MGLRRAAHVAWRRVGDETVLIHLRSKKIFVLNSSGGFFWHGLDGSRGCKEILEGLGLGERLPDNASNDLETFLSRLQEADLLESGSPERESGTGVVETEFPFSQFVPPELVWQEELRNFGQSCAFLPAQGEPCLTVPST